MFEVMERSEEKKTECLYFRKKGVNEKRDAFLIIKIT